VLQLPAEKKGNILIFAFADSEPSLDYITLQARAQAWDATIDLGLVRLLERLRSLNAMSEGHFL
jgi:hypothetical protein